jgi:ankyrin repeat protein
LRLTVLFKVNQVALQGLTPLHNATSFAQNDLVELLVKNGALINAKSGFDLLCSVFLPV